MTFKELIHGLNYDDIWRVLAQEYSLEEGAYETYKRVFEDLKTLEPDPYDSKTTLVVAKVEDCFEAGSFIFDIFGLEEGDESHYALEMTSWSEWLNFKVLDKSIELYGAAAVVAHAIYEMTFFGYSSESVDERVQHEKHILEERYDEVQNGTAELIPLDKAMAKIGYTDNRTPEEKAEQSKEFERISAKNKKVYNMLLG